MPVKLRLPAYQGLNPLQLHFSSEFNHPHAASDEATMPSPHLHLLKPVNASYQTSGDSLRISGALFRHDPRPSRLRIPPLLRKVSRVGRVHILLHRPRHLNHHCQNHNRRWKRCHDAMTYFKIWLLPLQERLIY